jgi:pyruvate formate lyase activating enzyme
MRKGKEEPYSLPRGMVKCRLCFRQCLVTDGEPGFCRKGKNHGGTFYTVVYGLPTKALVQPATVRDGFVGQKPQKSPL